MRAIIIIAFGFAIFVSSVGYSETLPWRVFATKNKVVRWVGRDYLVANPYKYRDKVIAFQARFVGSIGDRAIFSDQFADLHQALGVQMMWSKLLKSGDPVVIAVRVAGPTSGDAEDNLSLVDIYRCSKTTCVDFAKFDGGGMITEAQPQPVWVQRTSDPPLDPARRMDAN